MFSGLFIYVNASFGQEGDTASLSFPNVTLASTYKCLALKYYQAGSSAGSLSAALYYQDGSQEMIYINADDTNSKWFLQHIPFDTGLLKFQILATRGDTDAGLIAVDEIDILAEEDCVGMFRFGVFRHVIS